MILRKGESWECPTYGLDEQQIQELVELLEAWK